METIKQLITDGKTDEAIRLLDEYIEKNTSSDEAYYLRGNAYRKKRGYPAGPEQLSYGDGAELRQSRTNRPRSTDFNHELLQQGHVQPIRKAASITDTAFRC